MANHYTVRGKEISRDHRASCQVRTMGIWSEGIHSLQVLAFGDFSFDGWYGRGNILLCRQSDSAEMQQCSVPGKNYRHLTESDQYLWDLLRKYSHVLQACQTRT